MVVDPYTEGAIHNVVDDDDDDVPDNLVDEDEDAEEAEDTAKLEAMLEEQGKRPQLKRKRGGRFKEVYKLAYLMNKGKAEAKGMLKAKGKHGESTVQGKHIGPIVIGAASSSDGKDKGTGKGTHKTLGKGKASSSSEPQADGSLWFRQFKKN